MVEINLQGHFIIDLEHNGKAARCILNDERDPIIGTIFIDGKEKMQKVFQEENYPGAASACQYLEGFARRLLEKESA
jgi:hypothetical protein